MERVVALEGGRNFRDMGGYETRDGRRTKWGKLYRSGSMGGLTAEAYLQLAQLGVRSICDLRTRAERETHPVDVSQIPDVSYWARDYELSFGDLRKLATAGGITPETARSAMVRGYRDLPFEQAASHAELFRRLAAGDVPLILNCSAGKDRTGVAAALVLSALGVSEEQILEDFLLTRVTLDRAELIRGRVIWSMDDEVTAVVLGVEPDFMHAALASVREAHGSVEGYLEERLGLDGRGLESLRNHLLE